MRRVVGVWNGSAEELGPPRRAASSTRDFSKHSAAATSGQRRSWCPRTRPRVRGAIGMGTSPKGRRDAKTSARVRLRRLTLGAVLGATGATVAMGRVVAIEHPGGSNSEIRSEQTPSRTTAGHSSGSTANTSKSSSPTTTSTTDPASSSGQGTARATSVTTTTAGTTTTTTTAPTTTTTKPVTTSGGTSR